MKSIVNAVIPASTALAVVMGTLMASQVYAGDMPRRTIIAVDTSGSSTFTVDQPSAEAAATHVERYVAALDHPHEVRMISVGEIGRSNRTIDIRATVTNHRATSAKRLAMEFGGYFRALPTMNIKEGATTSLVQFFQSLGSVCARAPTKVIVFTDGLEWSSIVDGRAFAKGAVGLPKPNGLFLAGCSVEMNGVGEVRGSSNSDGLEQRLIPQWKSYLDAAGADHVVVTGSFFDF